MTFDLARFGQAMALLSGGLVAAAVIGHKLVSVTVHGTSMEPAYHDGDRILVRRTSRFAVGQVVVATWPVLHETTGRKWLVKRVAAVPGDLVPRDRVPALDATDERVPPGKLVLLGDNREVSVDSRQLGYFSTDDVLGVAIGRRHLITCRTPSSSPL